MEENQPLPHRSRRAASKPPLPPEATPILSKQSRLTRSSTSQASGSSFELPETPIPISTVTLVTPTIIGTSVTEVESPQLLEETRTESSEMVTQVVQQQVDSQPKVVQQEITSELESIQPEADLEPIIVQSEVTSEP